MGITRKEFLVSGLFSFGREIFSSVAQGESHSDKESVEGGMVSINKKSCLSFTGGCFSCIDHCPENALITEKNMGISINSELCSGCGECSKICPVYPPAITLKSAETVAQ